MKIVIMGDHVTSFPKESLENSEVDFVLCGGDFDFCLADLCGWISKIKKKCPRGIYYRKGKKIINSGKFNLKHNLNELSIIDRELTKWKLYEKEYNLLKLMMERDMDAETAVHMLQVSKEELNMMIRKLSNMEMLQYVDYDTLELTDLGINFLSKKDNKNKD